jgi:hypothetical protein
MSLVFQNIDPSVPHPPHSLGGEGGGQYFGRRDTQLCILHMYGKYFVLQVQYIFSYIFLLGRGDRLVLYCTYIHCCEFFLDVHYICSVVE